MTNFYITNDYKLRKIYGYKTFYDFGAPIKGMYSTNLGGTEYLLVASDGKLYSFLKSALEGIWEENDPHPTVPKVTPYYKNYLTIPLTYGELRIYVEYISQDVAENKTTYKIKTTYYTEMNSVSSSSASLIVDGTTKTYSHFYVESGETTLLEETKTIEHENDGSSPVKSISVYWHDFFDNKSASVNVRFPTLAPNPIVGIAPTLIGTIGTGDVSFFTFDKKVYILSGKYHSWDGTTLTEVEGYTPLVFINTPPAGGGIIYDEINMLSPKKHQTFNGDGTSTVYHLAQNKAITGANLASIDKVLVNGTQMTVSSDYTVDLELGTVTFSTAPSQGMDNVDIYWTYDDGDRGIIEGMKFGTVFGGDIDSRVFLYGNPTYPNRTYFSGIADDGANVVPSVEYFPATAQVDVGPSNFALTDLTRQYDRLLATTNRPEAYYMTIGTETLDVTLSDSSTAKRYVPSVATFPLNEIHGNVAPGQGQLIDNYPVTIDRNGLTLWKATNVRDEKNMEDISQKIKEDLKDLTLKSMKTLDHQSENQLWFGYNNHLYIYNYYNKTFSRLKITDELKTLADVGNNVYMGLSDGKVVKWGEEFDGFNDYIIDAHWEMNFSDFDVAYLRKTMNRLWVLMQPQGKSSADIGFVTNRAESQTKKHIEYKIQVMDDVDFADFSFKISANPQPFRLKMKAKKFTNLKIVIDNTEDTDCTILQLVLKVESFGESK